MNQAWQWLKNGLCRCSSTHAYLRQLGAWHWWGWGDNGEALFSPSVLSWIVTGDSQGILQPTKCFFLFVVSIWKRVNFTCKSSYFKFLLKNGRQHQAGFLNLLELRGDVLFNLIGCRPPAPRLIGYPLPFPVNIDFVSYYRHTEHGKIHASNAQSEDGKRHVSEHLGILG